MVIQFRIISNNYWTQIAWLFALIQVDLLTHGWPASKAVLQNFAVVHCYLMILCNSEVLSSH